MTRKTCILPAVLVLLAAVELFAVATNNFFGAIFTSKGDGTTVNQNVYDSKGDVYLNGGPQNTSSQGLPDGTYYFQVTDPGGAVLLSSDNAMCRQLKVAGGRVAGATGLCPHANGTYDSISGSTPVQLVPFSDTPNAGGEYKVWLIRQTSSTSIDPNDSKKINFRSADAKTDNFKVKKVIVAGLDPLLSGKKFYDANGNGSFDPGESGVAGVRVNVYLNSQLYQTTITDNDGNWVVAIPNDISYRVCEQLPTTCPADATGSYWLQTAPAPDSNGERCYSGLAGSSDIEHLNFGNLAFVPPHGGLTLGFWSNKNGQAVMKANDNFAAALLYLKNLNLKKPDGSDFDPASYTDFRNWLLNGNAVNMAYMLSVQLAATSLDVKYGYLSDSTLVDATSLGLGIVSIGTLRNNANSELNISGGNVTFTGNPLRQDEEILKDALDSINNNKLFFASPTPLGVCYP
jgi:hypothetical protein